MTNKYIRYLGPADEFVDGDTTWKKEGEPQGVPTERANELLAEKTSWFEEALKDDGPLYDEAGEAAKITTPEGYVRWKHPETGQISMTPIPVANPQLADEKAALKPDARQEKHGIEDSDAKGGK